MTGSIIAAYKGPAGPDVLAFARTWSRDSGKPLHVVTVYPGQAPLGMGRTDAEWVAYNHELADDLLAQAREALGDTPAEFTAVAAHSASHGLHDVMENAGPDTVVVVGSRKTRGVRRTSPGSTADRLLQGAPGPVAIVPWDYEQDPPASITRVAVAYVDTPDARAALVAAGEMAAELKAEVGLYSVVPDTRVRPAMGEPARFAVEQRQSFHASLDRAAASLPAGVTADVHLLEGPVVDALADLRPEQADLLVCGSRGYGPARRVLLGGVSSRVLHHARLPVVIVPRA